MGAFGYYQRSLWHVSITGNDITGDGSKNNPFRTIQHGIDVSANGDTVLVAPGVYYENIVFSGHSIVLGSSYLNSSIYDYIINTIIDGSQAGSVVTIANGEDSTTQIIGFTLQNGYMDGGAGLMCYLTSPTIAYNRIINNDVTLNGAGIRLHTSNASINHNLIANNLAGNTAGGISISINSNPIIENNTIANNIALGLGGGGIWADVGSMVTISNSILWGNNPQEIYIDQATLNITYSDIQGGWEGVGNIDADPLFVDSLSGNYHLQSNSPCIDTGDPNSPLDPDGTRADMGHFTSIIVVFTMSPATSITTAFPMVMM